jgi:hypothetical protein
MLYFGEPIETQFACWASVGVLTGFETSTQN